MFCGIEINFIVNIFVYCCFKKFIMIWIFKKVKGMNIRKVKGWYLLFWILGGFDL